MPIWVLVIQDLADSPPTITPSIHKTFSEAQEALYEFAIDCWPTEILGDPGETSMSKAISRFFEYLDQDYCFDLQQLEIGNVPPSLEKDNPNAPEEIPISDKELRLTSIALQYTNIVNLAKELGESAQEVEDQVVEMAKKLG